MLGAIAVLMVAAISGWWVWDRHRHEGPFVVNGNHGFKSLGEAVTAAADGEVITIEDNGP